MLDVVKRKTVNRLNHSLLHRLDGLLKPRSADFSWPPVFIIGAPRSGSTLLMQVMIQAFDVGYFSNLHAKVFGAPQLAQVLSRWLGSRSRSGSEPAYDSDYGVVKGLMSPSESGEFWYRFFPRSPHFVENDDVDSAMMRKLRNSLLKFGEEVNKPLVFKNMPIALRLGPILSHIPEALFIVTHRNEVDNAMSLLQARKNIYGNYDTWWSMQPPGFRELLNLPVEQQVVEQIRRIYSAIDAGFAKFNVNTDRVFHLNYEEFCSDVDKTVNELAEFFNRNHIEIERKFEYPRQFQVRRGHILPDKMLQNVKSYAAGE